MKTIILRLNNPIQSFGCSRDLYDENLTEPTPTFSTVLGIVANAMGMDREDTEKLKYLTTNINLGYAVLNYPTELDDFQTAGIGDNLSAEERFDFLKNEMGLKKKANQTLYEEFFYDSVPKGIYDFGAKKNSGNNATIHKYYNVGGDYLVGLSGNDDVISECYQALENPARYLYIGRKNCPINSNFLVGIEDLSLDKAIIKQLKIYSNDKESDSIDFSSKKYEICLPSNYDNSFKNIYKLQKEMVKDYPLSWESHNRRFVSREVIKFIYDVNVEANIYNDFFEKKV